MKEKQLVDIEILTGTKTKFEADAIYLPHFEGDAVSKMEKTFDQASGLGLSQALKMKDFSGKAYATQMFYPAGSYDYKRIIIVGGGQKKALNFEVLRRLGATIAKQLQETKLAKAIISMDNLLSDQYNMEETIREFVIGIQLALYTLTDFKKKPPTATFPEKIILHFSKTMPATKAKEVVAQANAIASGVYLTRDLVNLPPNTATPTYLASQATELAKTYGMTVEVFNPEDLQKQGMGGILAVSKGSSEEPRFIVLEHKGKKSLDTIVLIGKGVTFDSGGISIKPGEGMERMKTDMSGAAAVLGTMKAIAQLDLPLHVVCLVPAVENMPDGNAFKPSDIIKLLDGTTVEIINTDSEGRLVLADALCYAQRYNAKAVIDIATLTGARSIALGDHAIGLFSNADALAERLINSGNKTYERVWRLPLFDEYRESLSSVFADIKHMGAKTGGAIIAAKFLQEFVADYNWAHLDIAGLVSTEKPKFYTQGYATGIGTRLLVQLLVEWKNKK